MFALVVSGVVLIVLLAARRIGRRTYVPFGPFFILGALWAVLLRGLGGRAEPFRGRPGPGRRPDHRPSAAGRARPGLGAYHALKPVSSGVVPTPDGDPPAGVAV